MDHQNRWNASQTLVAKKVTEALDFSDLNDDQLVELAVELAREAMRRNPALVAAFEQALLDEYERVAAAARGAEKAKKAAAAVLEAQTERAEALRHRELLRRREQDALAEYLRQVADIIGKPVDQLTLVWNKNPWGRDKGPKIQVDSGAVGVGNAMWHLVDYLTEKQQLYTSPGLHDKQAELLPWCREVHAVITALDIRQRVAIKGIEL